MKPQHYHKRADRELQCQLCPHKCRIKPGRTGICRVRTNRAGEMDLPFYGRLSSVAVDPIEKKPLYHFYPGRQILSAGFWGCNFRCPFCQNYRISQQTSGHSEFMAPEKLVELTVNNNSFGIAYTYSEPLVHFEYIKDTAILAREQGLKNVLVSNGFINPGPAAELLPLLDAANIDLKSFNPEFYRQKIGGSLEEVKRFLSQAAGEIALEVTTLVIPGKNDSDTEISAIAGFLAGLSPDLPLHLSCYYPTYHYTIPPTEGDRVFHLAGIAQKYLHYVYPGNVGHQAVTTCCPGCGTVLVERTGYRTRVLALVDGRCSQCHEKIAVIQ